MYLIGGKLAYTNCKRDPCGGYIVEIKNALGVGSPMDKENCWSDRGATGSMW